VPDISILQPQVLLGVLRRFTTPESLTLLSRVPTQNHPFPTAEWQVVRGSRAIAKPNVPNSEANIVPRLGRSSVQAAFMYLREKKVFEPTTLHWLRQAAANNLQDLGVNQQAEQAVTRELADLNQRADNLAEYALWQSLTGRLVIDSETVQADVDYKFLASHKAAPAVSWANATPAGIVADVTAFKRLVERDGRVRAVDAYATEKTLAYIFQSFATGGTGNPGVLMSDRMKDSYFASGTIPGFMGLNWMPQTAVFDAVGASYTANPTDPYQETPFLADDTLIIGNFTDNRPIELMVGPTADDSAPVGYTGKFTKTWKEEDPSARQILLEWHFLPVITRPEQFVYVGNVTQPAAG
jgi:hypothetical protein